MNKKVGQRVRLVRNENAMSTVPVGAEGVVEQVFSGMPERVKQFYLRFAREPAAQKDLDCAWLRVRLDKHGELYGPHYHFEPIIDKPESTTWEEMGFHPNDFTKQKDRVT